MPNLAGPSFNDPDGFRWLATLSVEQLPYFVIPFMLLGTMLTLAKLE